MREVKLGSPLLLLAVFGLMTGACSSSGSTGPSGTDAGSQDEQRSDEAAAGDDTGSNVPSDSAAADGSGETGAADGDVPEAAASPTCGSPPARFTVLTGANAGLVRDNVTGLLWMNDSVGGGEPPQTQTKAASYCSGRGMRLPTKDEALALAASYAPCAFGQWSTWTSTAAGAGDAWVVDYMSGSSPQIIGNFPSAVLCVKASSDQ